MKKCDPKPKNGSLEESPQPSQERVQPVRHCLPVKKQAYKTVFWFSYNHNFRIKIKFMFGYLSF